jgi:hypothetical protein
MSEESFGIGFSAAEIEVDFEGVSAAALSEDGIAEASADFGDGGGIFESGFFERGERISA